MVSPEWEIMETIDELKKQIAGLTENEQLKEHSRHTDEVNEAYQESQHRFRTVFEASRLGNKIINADLEILQVNSALIKLCRSAKGGTGADQPGEQRH